MQEVHNTVLDLSGTTCFAAGINVGVGIVEGVAILGEVSPLKTAIICSANDCNNGYADSGILGGGPPGVTMMG